MKSALVSEIIKVLRMSPLRQCQEIVSRRDVAHSSFSNSSGMTNSGFWNSWCAPILRKLSWSCSRASKKTFYVINTHVPFSFTDSNNLCKALHVILNRSDVERYFWALDQLHGSVSDIGAHKDFQKPESTGSEGKK